ncbi:MAG: lamin tail domain-containing protein [Ilumatobacteraceae bacterium]
MMDDSTPPIGMAVPWWKRRWRRLPFWAWAGVAITGVGVVGALAGGGGSGGGTAAVADLARTSPPLATDAGVTGGQPSTTIATTSSPPTVAPTTTSSPPTTSTTSTTSTTVAPTSTAAAPVPTAPATTAPPPTEAPVAAVAPWTVTSVIDGDTIDVAGPDGAFTVRLIGINTPESNECWAGEATAALSVLIAGQPVTLVRDASDTDQYGRALRFVETADGVDVGAALVEAGHAISRRYAPDTSRNDRYDALQRQASEAGLGQWAPDACGAPVADVSITVEIRYDADGDDNHNLNDEWVRFANAGSAAVDLAGWVVADESASHRYEFAALQLAPGGSVTLFTGCGADTADARYWCNTGSAVWNNSGDTVFLRDPSGNNVVVHEY